jgi:hypothetical protein
VYRGPGVSEVDRMQWREDNGIKGEEVRYGFPKDAGTR